MELPVEEVAERRAGRLTEAGWVLTFVWGVAGGREFLELYACHRMTSDRHTRIWEDGRTEELEAFAEVTVYPPGADAEQSARIDAAAWARDRRIKEDLLTKGLLWNVEEDL